MTDRTRLPLPEPIGIVWADGRPHHTYTAYQMYEYADAETAALAEKVRVLREDAERYRWLRDKARSVDWTEDINGWSWFTRCRIGARGMDADIDAARAALEATK